MALPNILLSLLCLSDEPMSGTDLVGLFRGSIRHYWHTDLSQIYRALETLERDKCVSSRSTPSPRGPARRVYRLTAKGRKRLAAWVASEATLPPVKLEYLAKVFAAITADDPRASARRQLEAMRDEAIADLERLERIDRQFTDLPGYPDAMPAELFYPWLTLRHGLLRRRAVVDWIEESLARFDNRPKKTDRTVTPDSMAGLMRVLTELNALNQEADR